MAGAITWRTEKRKLSQLKKWEQNPRQATEQQATDLQKSLDRYSLAAPLIINTDNLIIGGHFRYDLLLKKYGKDHRVDVRVPNRKLTPKEVEELNLRLNKNLGEWSYDLLSKFDEDILAAIGFDSQELDFIFKDHLRIDSADDEVPPIPKKTNIKRGDLFQLGRHRLLCGDATKSEDATKLMKGNKASMIFTDPPYNVNYTGMQKSRKWEPLKNDKVPEKDFVAFLSESFKNFYEYSIDSSPAYICHADQSHQSFKQALEQVGFRWRATIIWIKNTPAYNYAQYKYRHEPIFYCHKKGKKTRWFGGTNQSTVWQENKESGDHPTIKPVALITRAIINSSQRKDLIIDFFGGSGSTLIACEKLNRICNMMEIEPLYCQVIINRWQKYTGLKAKKA